VTHDCVSYVKELFSDQEEADTRLILHTKYCSNHGINTVVVVSPDTDVLVLLVHHFNSLGLEKLYFKTGRRQLHCNTTRFVPVHNIVKMLSVEQRNIMLTVYCLTGCDSCSAFYGIGKKTAFKVMMSNAADLQTIADLGNTPFLCANARRGCTNFVGLLYGSKACISLDVLRKDKVLSNKHVRPRMLPPTDDSFVLHLMSCLYQLLVWKGCLTDMQKLPDPVGYGYRTDSASGTLIPQMMSQPAAVPELLSDLVCVCSDQCVASYNCSSNEQPCTQACACQGKVQGDDSVLCNNIFTVLASVTGDISSE